MITYSVADVSERRDASAEVMAKAAVSAEETAEESMAVKTENAEDSAVVTETVERTAAPVPARTEDAAEMRTVKTEENGAAVIKRQRTANTPETEPREKQKRERNGKSQASATASPRERDLNFIEEFYGFAAKAAVVLSRQIVYS